MLAAIRQHIEAKMAAVELERSPFPHLIIENFFPDDVFAKILQYNPFRKNAGAEWMSRATSSNVTARTPYFARKQINFHVNQKFDAPAEEQVFWDDIRNCFLGDHWFVQTVIAKYREYFVLRFGDLVNDPNFCSLLVKELFLQRHEPGFLIGPHTDIPPRVFTCIFAFADREGFEEYGTQMLVHKDPLVRCWGNDHYAPNDFTVKKIAPYKPNNFFLFFKTRQSFHSVKAIDATVPNQRCGMQFQWYEPMGGVFRDLSTPWLFHFLHK